MSQPKKKCSKCGAARSEAACPKCGHVHKRGGKREGAGPKKKERLELPKIDGRTTVGRVIAQQILQIARAKDIYLALIELECKRLGIDENRRLVPVEKDKDGNVITGPDYQGAFSIIPLTTLLQKLDDRAWGRPPDTVNHIHNKPLDVNMNVSLSERFRIAMEKAEKRLAGAR